jgi:hypothetical protein
LPKCKTLKLHLIQILLSVDYFIQQSGIEVSHTKAMEKKLKRRQEMEENKKNKVKSQVKKMEEIDLKT